MKANSIHRPDADAMEKLLEGHVNDAVGTAVRLAWQAGLSRVEIARLTWESVSFLNGEIELPDRSVPLCEELEGYLSALAARMSSRHRYVLLSDARRQPMQPQPISALVRQALDQVGQTEVTLRDLRSDFIVRQLACQDWQYVSRIAGIEAAAIERRFAPYISGGTLSTRIDGAKRPPEPDELRLRRLLQDEGDSPAGITIRLVWQAGLRVAEAEGLTWGQVDFVNGVILLKDRSVPLPPKLAAFLLPLRGAPEDCLLTTRSTARPLLADRLSRMARAALVQAGLDNISLLSLWCDYNRRNNGTDAILQDVRERGSVSRREVMERFGVTRSTAYERLSALIRQGSLVRLGTRYFPAGAVIPPAEQYSAVEAYLREVGVAYRQDLARVLRITPTQCTFVLKRLVAEGKLLREKQRYRLPEFCDRPEKCTF